MRIFNIIFDVYLNVAVDVAVREYKGKLIMYFNLIFPLNTFIIFRFH